MADQPGIAWSVPEVRKEISQRRPVLQVPRCCPPSYYAADSPKEGRDSVGRTKIRLPKRQTDSEVSQTQRNEMTDLQKFITRVFNSGYHTGHNDTVEACYINILSEDMDTFQADIVPMIPKDIIRGQLRSRSGLN